MTSVYVGQGSPTDNIIADGYEHMILAAIHLILLLILIKHMYLVENSYKNHHRGYKICLRILTN